jgi:hypothetical protein
MVPLAVDGGHATAELTSLSAARSFCSTEATPEDIVPAVLGDWQH